MQKYEESRISIHSPYTRRDFTVFSLLFQFYYFNPLSLYKERRVAVHPNFPAIHNFNPLSLYKERPILIHRTLECVRFQSTLPIQGETRVSTYAYLYYNYFNPLSLYKERLHSVQIFILISLFQSTLPIQGETAKINNILLSQLYILHRKISYILFSEDISSVFRN